MRRYALYRVPVLVLVCICGPTLCHLRPETEPDTSWFLERCGVSSLRTSSPAPPPPRSQSCFSTLTGDERSGRVQLKLSGGSLFTEQIDITKRSVSLSLRPAFCASEWTTEIHFLLQRDNKKVALVHAACSERRDMRRVEAGR